MRRICALLLFSTILLGLAPVQVQAQVEITITVNAYDQFGSLKRSDDLVICVAGNSVDQISPFDVNDDILPPVPPNTAYDVRLRNPNEAGQDGKIDCRALPVNVGDAKEFGIIYQPGTDVDAIELVWDPDEIRSVSQFGDVVLTDAFGGAILPTIQMADNSSYSISSGDPGFDLDFRVTMGFAGLFLPVELLDFKANLDRSQLELLWSTATETNNSGFQVQMKTQYENDWSELGFVEGHGSILERQDYSFYVGDLEAGVYKFRLKQIDFDGAFEIHPEIEVQVDLPNTHSLSSAYPNPFNPSTSFSLIVKSQQKVKIDLLNALGQIQATIYDGVLSGGTKNQFTIEADGLPTGVYFYRAEGEEFSTSRKVILLR